MSNHLDIKSKYPVSQRKTNKYQCIVNNFVNSGKIQYIVHLIHMDTLRQKMEAILKKLIEILFFFAAGLLGIFTVSFGGYMLFLAIFEGGKWRDFHLFVSFCSFLISFVAFYFFWSSSKKNWTRTQKQLWVLVTILSIISLFALTYYDQVFLRATS